MMKHKADSSVERYKVRLVAKGFTQHKVLDYTKTFLPVAKMVSIKYAFDVAVVKGCYLGQLDVKNSFLHGDLEE